MTTENKEMSGTNGILLPRKMPNREIMSETYTQQMVPVNSNPTPTIATATISDAVDRENRIAFNKQLRAMLVEEGLKPTNPLSKNSKTRIEKVVQRVFDEAERGEAWAVQLIFERVEGKVTQPIEAPGNTQILVIRGGSMNEL